MFYLRDCSYSSVWFDPTQTGNQTPILAARTGTAMTAAPHVDSSAATRLAILADYQDRTSTVCP